MAEAVRDGVKVPTTVEDYCVKTVFSEQKPAVPEMLMDTSDFYYSDDSDQDEDDFEYPDESDTEDVNEEVDMTGQNASSSSAQLKKTHHLPQASDATKTPNRDWRLWLRSLRGVEFGVESAGLWGLFSVCVRRRKKSRKRRDVCRLCVYSGEKTVEAIMFSSRLALLRWHTGGRVLREKKSDGLSGIFFLEEGCCILGVERTLLFSLFPFSRLSLFSRVFLYRFHRLTIPVT